MKKIMFLLFISLGMLNLRSMDQQEGSYICLPGDVLFKIVEDHMLSNIYKAANPDQLDKARKFAEFALLNKRHRNISDSVKETSDPVKNAYKNKKALFDRLSGWRFDEFKLFENGVDSWNLLGETALMVSIGLNNLDVFQWLIDNKANVNLKRKKDGRTALMHAIGCGSSRINMIKKLIKNNADIDMVDNYGWTALMSAAYHNLVDIAQLLLENGADNMIKNKNGETACDIATRENKKDNRHKEMVTLLEQYQ